MPVHHLEYNLQRLVPEYRQKKYLLALSGGADSVAMLYGAHLLGLKLCVAHCHFHLRGSESDADAEFCEKLSANLDYPFFYKTF